MRLNTLPCGKILGDGQILIATRQVAGKSAKAAANGVGRVVGGVVVVSNLYESHGFVSVLQRSLEIANIAVSSGGINIYSSAFFEAAIGWELVGDSGGFPASICGGRVSGLCDNATGACDLHPGLVEASGNFSIGLSAVIRRRERYFD